MFVEIGRFTMIVKVEIKAIIPLFSLMLWNRWSFIRFYSTFYYWLDFILIFFFTFFSFHSLYKFLFINRFNIYIDFEYALDYVTLQILPTSLLFHFTWSKYNTLFFKIENKKEN